MKKINNKFRNNNNNNSSYSLNYKFDSASAAGKFSGTALELIKKYNELAKDAHSNGNYVEMEVFRQYAEHYRKIVTEINERKNQNRENQNEQKKENAVETKANDVSEEKKNETPAEPAQPKTENVAPKENKVKLKAKKNRNLDVESNLISETPLVQVEPIHVELKVEKLSEFMTADAENKPQKRSVLKCKNTKQNNTAPKTENVEIIKTEAVAE